MDKTVKGTIAVVVAIAILFFAVFGSYLPMRKAQIFIGTLQSFQATPPTSLQDLESRLSAGLDYYSPIGQEELVRNTANSVLGLVQHGLDATTTADLMGFLNSYYDPILDRGKGMSFGQDLYLEGAVNEWRLSKPATRSIWKRRNIGTRKGVYSGQIGHRRSTASLMSTARKAT